MLQSQFTLEQRLAELHPTSDERRIAAASRSRRARGPNHADRSVPALATASVAASIGSKSDRAAAA